MRGAQSTEPKSITVNYDDLIDDVSVGDAILVDNGVIQLRVLAKKDNRIRCAILTAGTLGSRRHINLSGVHVNLPTLTEKDRAEITHVANAVFEQACAIMLTLLFFLAVTPIGLLQRLFRKRSCHVTFPGSERGYWEARDTGFDPLDYEKQF